VCEPSSGKVNTLVARSLDLVRLQQLYITAQRRDQAEGLGGAAAGAPGPAVLALPCSGVLCDDGCRMCVVCSRCSSGRDDPLR